MTREHRHRIRPRAMARPRVRTESFDAIRFLGALQVSTGHFNVYVGHRWGVLEFSGGVAVQIFFVMSGFVMAVAYNDKLRDAPASWRVSLSFLLRRATRIGPVYWLSALAFVPIALAQGFFPTAVIAANVPLTLLFVNAWLPFPYGRVLNFPLWTVTCQFFFWAAFPALVRRPWHASCRTPRQLAAFLTGCWLSLLGTSALAAELAALVQHALPAVATLRRRDRTLRPTRRSLGGHTSLPASRVLTAWPPPRPPPRDRCLWPPRVTAARLQSGFRRSGCELGCSM